MFAEIIELFDELLRLFAFDLAKLGGERRNSLAYGIRVVPGLAFAEKPVERRPDATVELIYIGFDFGKNRREGSALEAVHSLFSVFETGRSLPEFLSARFNLPCATIEFPLEALGAGSEDRSLFLDFPDLV